MALAAWQIRARTWPKVAWPDECIYLVGARTVADRGSLDTHFYLTYSLLRRGYPHRDVHMPGYVLVLAPFVKRMGMTWAAAATLNVALYALLAAAVFAFGCGVLCDRRQAALAAALVLVLPPFPGYLYVAYPEMLAAAIFMAGLAIAVHARGMAAAVTCGIVFALGAVVRETLLVALPLYVVTLPRRQLVRGFLPAAAATLLLVVAPLSRDRAVHPNALYPSAFEEARASDAPATALAGTIVRNVRANLTATMAANPRTSPEDAVLLFLAVLLAAGLAVGLARASTRRLALASLAALAILSMAVLALYVVRERGGVWGGVRVYMPWAPLLLVLATPLLFRRWGLRGALPIGVVVGTLFWAMDAWQIAFFNHYKATDLEDQERQALYIARYTDSMRPQRVAARAFTYGLSHYPVEVIWSLPRDNRELWALEKALPFDILAFHEKNALRFALIDNPRYRRLNKDDRGAEFLVWRRLY